MDGGCPMVVVGNASAVGQGCVAMAAWLWYHCGSVLGPYRSYDEPQNCSVEKASDESESSPQSDFLLTHAQRTTHENV